MTIDGYTQPGSSPNTLAQGTNAVLKVELSGANAGNVDGLVLTSNVSSTSAGSVVKGLAINRFQRSGIVSAFTTGSSIEGNFIGTDPSGTQDLGNGFNGASLSTGGILGGTTPAARNLISGNESHGVQVGGGGSNKVQGNLIGTDKNGTAPLGNGVPTGGNGVIVSSSSNTIGDSDPSDGPTNAANTIAFNRDSGVGISGTAGATGNRVLSNSIFSNTDLGIELFGGTEDPNGVTANDPRDPDTGPNNLQNYPVITSATTFFGGTTINGSLDSTPSTRKKKRSFTIRFFSSPAADASGYGEGKAFLGETKVTTNRQGTASFTFAPTRTVPEGQFVTATATNNSTGDTSEFSRARVVQGPVIGP